jgi:hypothetical protein
MSIRNLEQSVFCREGQKDDQEILGTVEKGLEEIRREGERQSKMMEQLEIRLDAVELR